MKKKRKKKKHSAHIDEQVKQVFFIFRYRICPRFAFPAQTRTFFSFLPSVSYHISSCVMTPCDLWPMSLLYDLHHKTAPIQRSKDRISLSQYWPAYIIKLNGVTIKMTHVVIMSNMRGPNNLKILYKHRNTNKDTLSAIGAAD